MTVGSLSFQPSEVLKLATLALAANILATRHEQMADPRRTLFPLMLIAGFGAGACLVQGDLGSAVVLGAIVLCGRLHRGRSDGLHDRACWLRGMLTMALLVFSSARRFNRFTAFFDTKGNKDYLAYQTYQGYLGIANGGLTGSGIGGSNSKLGYLPLAHSDFIFAVIADELGFVGAARGGRRDSRCWCGSGSRPRSPPLTVSGCCWPAASPPGSGFRRSSTWVASPGCCR